MIKMKITANLSNNSKWYIFPFLLLLIACPTEDEPPEPSPPDPAEYIEKGWDDLSSGFYEDALENFNEALSINPENIEATIGKAWCLFFTDSGSSMDMMRYLFEKGVDDSTWAANANCALSIVTFAQGHYTTAIAYADSLLSIAPVYVLDFYTEIDYHDILLVKAQAQFLTLEYNEANITMTQINPSLYLDPSQDSWEVNGTQYFIFESALSAIIASVTSEYDSGGFISIG
ncbi:MAG: hypothetical protein CMG69_05785 [Candidatus Marinimicrobia bacterium]|nr:hypothetical protein [Candidatus Neomarinimicrobiota bacterium]|tara:strand:- start:84426 stop:85118 length:693 start_codon:yes stop_codon:yes gene_type:complete